MYWLGSPIQNRPSAGAFFHRGEVKLGHLGHFSTLKTKSLALRCTFVVPRAFLIWQLLCVPGVGYVCLILVPIHYHLVYKVKRLSSGNGGQGGAWLQ
jgi:hypothetical protein